MSTSPTIVGGVSVRVKNAPRSRKGTEEGLQYRMETAESKVKACLKQYENLLAKGSLLIVSEEDPTAFKKQLETSIGELEGAYQTLKDGENTQLMRKM